MSNHSSSPSQIDQKSPENPQSTRKVFWVFVLYALSRSIKSSSSYLQPFNQYLDKLTDKNPNANCDKLLDAYHLRVQPLATTAQLFSYVFFVLTSSIIGFDIIIWLDIFCQIANVLLVAALYFEPLRKIFVSQLAAIVYGVATATGNVFHQYAYCVFDKSMFHKISGATRSATMSGHFLGGIFGIIASFWMYEDSNWIGMFEGLGAKPANFEDIKLSMYLKFVKIILFLMVTTAICMFFALFVSLFFPKMSKEAKAKNRKSISQVLNSIVKAAHQFTNPSVTFWGISWYLSFMCMLFCKSWAIPHFKQQQIRLNAPVWNSYADVFSYAAGAIGSLVPKKCLSLFGYQGTVTIQLFVSLAAAACAVGLSWEWPNIMGFYISHVAFTFLVYFSMAFQSGELARCVAPDQNKLVFYLLTFSVFLTQEFLNKVIFEGIGHCSEVPVIKRYIYMALFMGFNFLLVFVGFSGTSRGEQKKSEEMKKDLEKVATPRQEQQQEIVHSKKE